MLKIPYGESNIRTVLEGGYFYQDRTSYIETMENFSSKYLVFLRPRRFGKSLFISCLEHYYGVQHKNDFPSIFGRTYIGTHPTPNVNNYLILKWDFSGINTNSYQTTYDGFLAKILMGLKVFLSEYDTFFTQTQVEEILNQKEPQLALSQLFSTFQANSIDKKIYILVDEYDHFANEIIAFNFQEFSNMVSKNGFVRKFYENIKTATGDGVVERLFMTGVSPITLDSMTSGFNMAKNISLLSNFHSMMGFEENEVFEILQKIDVPTEQLTTVCDDLRTWYNGYLFSMDRLNRIYNPNMVLYFAQEYQINKKYPRTLLDPNIASDYTKIRRLFKIGDKETDTIETLKKLLQNEEIVSPLVTQFSFDRGFSDEDLISLLFYMGFLTIKNEELGAYRFTFPNYVIKKLYADYFLAYTREVGSLPIDNRPVNEAIRRMATEGNPTLFFDQMTMILKSLSPRDAKDFNENTLKAIAMSLLHQQTFYYVHSEYPSKHFYMDIFLEAIHGYNPNYEVAFEFKYLKKSENKQLENKLTEASIQLEEYLKTPIFTQKSNVKAWVVVVLHNKIHAREVQ